MFLNAKTRLVGLVCAVFLIVQSPVTQASSDCSVTIACSTKTSPTLVARTAAFIKALFGMGITMAGAVALIDSLNQKFGKDALAEGSIGVVALIAGIALLASNDTECSTCSSDCCNSHCCTHEIDCHDCYYHNHCVYHDPIVYQEVIQPVIHHHEHVVIEQPIIQHHEHVYVENTVIASAPEVVVPVVAAQMTPAAELQPVQASVNADNAEVNTFWNDPFNY